MNKLRISIVMIAGIGMFLTALGAVLVQQHEHKKYSTLKALQVVAYNKKLKATRKKIAAVRQNGLEGRVIDAKTKKPIANVIVTLGQEVVRTSQDGHFSMTGKDGIIKLRSPGYLVCL